MARLPASLRTYLRDARDAFSHAPLEVLLGMAVAVTFSVAIRRDGEEWWLRVACGAALALPLVFGLSVLRARRALSAAASWAASALVLAACAAYAGLLFDPERGAEVWRWAALTGAAVLAFSLVPTWRRGRGPAARRVFWAFNAGLLLRVLAVGAYGAALFAALAGAVAAVSALFELSTPDELYADLAGAVFFALVPWVIVGGIPALLAAERQAEEEAAAGTPVAPRLARLLGRYLYAPVLGIYLAILLAYTLKVLVTWEFPKNLLSPIVLFAGLAGFLGSLFLEPLLREPEHRGVARLIRALPLILLPLLPLPVWAVWVRRDQYGWTEFRYLRLALLLALAGLAVAGTVRLLRRREPLLRSVPLVLALVLLLSALGPWSASAVSRRDQQARLRSGLREAGLLREPGGVLHLRPPPEQPGAQAAAQRTVPRELYDRISGSLVYLYQAHGPGALRGVLAEPDSFRTGWDVVQALAIRPGCRPEEVRYLTANVPPGAPIPDLPAGSLVRWSATPERNVAPTPEAGAVRVWLQGAQARVEWAAGPERWTAHAGLAPVVEHLRRLQPTDCGDSPGRENRLDPAATRFVVRDTAGRERGVLVVTSIGIDNGEAPDGQPRTGWRVTNAEGVLLVP